MNCLYCQKELKPKEGESPSKFRARAYCDNTCYREHIRQYGGWSTWAELEFLKSIGKHSTLKVPKRDLLKGYLEGAKKRVEWGAISEPIVVQRVKEMLGAEI